MQARKLAPPAPMTEQDRREYAAAPTPRRKADGSPLAPVSDEWIYRYTPVQYRKAGADIAEQAIVETRASRPLTEADASTSRSIIMRGGVKTDEYRETARETGNRELGRYVARVIETRRPAQPLTDAERETARKAGKYHVVGTGKVASAVRALTDAEHADLVARVCGELGCTVEQFRTLSLATRAALLNAAS